MTFQRVASENEAAIQQLQSILSSGAGDQQTKTEVAQLFALANAVKASLQEMASGAKDERKFDNIIAAHQNVMTRLAALVPEDAAGPVQTVTPMAQDEEQARLRNIEQRSQLMARVFTPLNIGIGIAALAGLYIFTRRRSGPTQISEAEMDALLASGEYELNEDCGCGG
jgi:hypothetical protein